MLYSDEKNSDLENGERNWKSQRKILFLLWQSISMCKTETIMLIFFFFNDAWGYID